MFSALAVCPWPKLSSDAFALATRDIAYKCFPSEFWRISGFRSYFCNFDT